jgi:hypothetical protein
MIVQCICYQEFKEELALCEAGVVAPLIKLAFQPVASRRFCIGTTNG